MNYISGTAHDMMALIEIEEELKKYLEPAKQKAEQRIDELSTIVRETTQTLREWDSHTEQSVSELHRARDEQVCERINTHSLVYILYVTLTRFKSQSNWTNNWMTLIACVVIKDAPTDLHIYESFLLPVELSPSNINQSNLINNSVPSKIPEILMSFLLLKHMVCQNCPPTFSEWKTQK